MKLLKSFRKWVRKYMSFLETKDSLSVLDIILSSLFKLIANILKLLKGIILLTKTSLDYRTKKDLNVVKEFLGNEEKEQVCFVYAPQIRDAERSKEYQTSDCSKTILLVENAPSLKILPSRELMIPSKLFLKYFTEIRKLLINRHGKVLFLEASMENIYLLSEFNSMNFKTIYRDIHNCTDREVSNFFKKNSSEIILEKKDN